MRRTPPSIYRYCVMVHLRVLLSGIVFSWCHAIDIESTQLCLLICWSNSAGLIQHTQYMYSCNVEKQQAFFDYFFGKRNIALFSKLQYGASLDYRSACIEMSVVYLAGRAISQSEQQVYYDICCNKNFFPKKLIFSLLDFKPLDGEKQEIN